MYVLFPELKINQEWMLPVDDTHTLYIEESGNPEGIPVLVLHGGPGAGCGSHQRRYFDAERYRIIMFDQRGCGRSTPLAELENNTTMELVADIETIRQNLGIEKWLLFGGSWGATLALVYAQTHPDQCLGLILRGTFLGRQFDIDWLYKEGANKFYPEAWDRFIADIPPEERNDLVDAYYRNLTSSNELRRIQAAKAWCRWEGECSTLQPNPALLEKYTSPHTAIAMARIEAHYFKHGNFLEEGQVLNRVSVLKNLPAIVVHGRYDIVCPVDAAFALTEDWNNAELMVVRNAGHSATEPAIVDALIKACEKMSERFESEYL